MYVEKIKGKGSAVVLLHGWGQSSREMKPLAELLSPISEPCLIDLPGFGNSPPPPSHWSAWDYADAIAASMKNQNIRRLDLIGHSFGGKVAACLAISHPDLVRKLVLIASSGLIPNKSFTQKCRSRLIRMGGKTLKRISPAAFDHWFAPKFGSKDYREAGAMREILVRSVNEDLSSELPKIHQPTLLLWGAKDRDTPIEMGERMKRLIQGSQLQTFSQHGHQLHLDGGAHLLASKIAPFLLSENPS